MTVEVAVRGSQKRKRAILGVAVVPDATIKGDLLEVALSALGYRFFDRRLGASLYEKGSSLVSEKDLSARMVAAH